MDNLRNFRFCTVCGNYFSIKENTLQIKNAPEVTFNFSDKTVTLNIGECTFCGAVQLFDVNLSEDYKSVYRSIRVSSKYRNEKKEQIKQFIEKYNLQDKIVLEFGCGDGQILEIFKELKIDCYGIEFGENNYYKCIKNNFKVFNEYRNTRTDMPIFNFIYSSYVLEHFPNPKEICNQIYRMLFPGGIAVIEVPNYDVIEKNNLWLEFSKDHRFYYRKQTLFYLFTICGFKIEEITEVNDGLGYSVVLSKPKYNNSFKTIQYKMDNNISKFNELIKSINNDYAIYGASHYVQMLLNQISIMPKNIYDGNLQKCGSKIKEIEIEYKDNIKNCKSVNIIISCGGYNKEIKEMLEKMNLNKNLIIWE
jgi:SAM-dependent methyltransferase